MPGTGAVRVVLWDGAARMRTFTVPSDWTGALLLGQPGQGVLDLTTLAGQPGFGSVATATEDPGFDPDGVVQLTVHLDGSGAVDDLSFCSASLPRAAVRVRDGAGNPRNLGAFTLPLLGTEFVVDLDCRGSGPGLAMVSVHRAASSGPMTPFGELLVRGRLVSQIAQPSSGTASRFVWNLPSDLGLLGLEVHVQGFCRSVTGPGQGKTRLLRGTLSNALDLTLGF